jgi:hypothetical protein
VRPEILGKMKNVNDFIGSRPRNPQPAYASQSAWRILHKRLAAGAEFSGLPPSTFAFLHTSSTAAEGCGVIYVVATIHNFVFRAAKFPIESATRLGFF